VTHWLNSTALRLLGEDPSWAELAVAGPLLTGRFREVLAESGVPVVELTGDRAARLRTAAAVDALLARGWRLADPIQPRDNLCI
jgi:hypothetical protein